VANLIETEEEIKLSDEHTSLKWIKEDEIKNGFRRYKCKN